jgi:hypothetical protein
MKRKSPVEVAREKVQAELKGKTLVRVNYAALEKKTPRYPDAMFYLQSGWYRDYPFQCADCGKLEIWTATQQKWWYEVAKGGILTIARRCRTCRKAHREKEDVDRKQTLDGFSRKKKPNQAPEPTAPSGRGSS